MKTLTLCVFAATIAWNTERATIIDIDAEVNDLLNPVFVFLEAGTYSVVPVGIANGGAYDAWSPWAVTTCDEPTGCIQTVPTTSAGWKISYDVVSGALGTVEVDGITLLPIDAVPTGTDFFNDFFVVSAASTRYHVDDQTVYPTALDARGMARPSTFTLATAGFVGFAISDIRPLADNRGGMSLHVFEIGGPSAPLPPSGGCATPDPFVALGGGTCVNGGWLPPGIAAPSAGDPALRVPPPPPTSSGGCATPDPFVALGGGTCVNGGWLPPSIAAPAPGAPAPPPPPPPSGGCATPDPFVALGGGTCVNGGWLPPGIAAPAPGGPAPPPPPPPPPSGGCATPDPFVALGGGTCINGGWLPPGMAGPATGDPASPRPPPVGSIDPVVTIQATYRCNPSCFNDPDNYELNIDCVGGRCAHRVRTPNAMLSPNTLTWTGALSPGPHTIEVKLRSSTLIDLSFRSSPGSSGGVTPGSIRVIVAGSSSNTVISPCNVSARLGVFEVLYGFDVMLGMRGTVC